MDTVTIKEVSGKTHKTHVFNVESLKDVSDGYHTIDELYQHRILLFLLLCKTSSYVCYYKEDPNAPDWVIVYLYLTPGNTQISYHVPKTYLPAIKKFATEDHDHKWDGHTSNDVLARLEEIL